MSTEVRGEIPLKDLEQRLSEVLGPRYEVTVISDTTLKVRRMLAVTAKIRVSWHGDRTHLLVIPGGVWIIQGINALTVAPKVRHAIDRTFQTEAATPA